MTIAKTQESFTFTVGKLGVFYAIYFGLFLTPNRLQMQGWR